MLNIEPRGTVPEEQIASAEKTLGLRLPEPYRSWLKETDGGLVPEDTVIPGTAGPGLISELDGIEWMPRIGRFGRMQIVPSDYLVVSQGSSGGCLTIKIHGDDYGSVWWADFDKAEDEGVWESPTESIMVRLADDWNGFLTLEFEQ